MSSSIQQFNDFVKTIPDADTLNHLHDVLGKIGVKVVYEKAANFDQDKPVYTRLMFGTFKRSCPFEFPGVIMGQNLDDKNNENKYKAVSVPPSPPVTQYQSKFLYKHFGRDMNIIKANDGTTVTLYYFGSKWVISTHRGFEVNSYNWIAQKTYQDVVREVLEEYPDFSYDKLDTCKCYTFGFNHSDFHPFRENNENLELENLKISESKFKEEFKENNPAEPTKNTKPSVRAWFIQSVDLVKFNASDISYVSYDEKIGLPVQECVKFSNIKHLFQSANNAYTEYTKNGSVNYGYLIRIGLKQFLVESTLLKHIRHIFYSNKFNNINDTFDKRKYIIVNTFLDSSKHTVFRKLFPQYKSQFDIMEQKMDDLVNAIIRINKDLKENKKIEPNNIVDVVAKELYEQITKTITLSNRDEDEVTNLLYTYIYNTQYTNLVYQLVF
jgi:hypothetical protein